MVEVEDKSKRVSLGGFGAGRGVIKVGVRGGLSAEATESLWWDRVEIQLAEDVTNFMNSIEPGIDVQYVRRRWRIRCQ